MDPVATARRLSAHIPSGPRKERLEKSLTTFLTGLEQITAADPDDDLFRRQDEEAAYNDGIVSISASEAAQADKTRVNDLRNLINPGTPDEPQRQPASETLEIVPGDDIDERGRFGYTKLVRAVVAENLEAVIAICGEMANPFIPDNCGMTALIRARLGDNDKIVTLLEKYEEAYEEAHGEEIPNDETVSVLVDR